MHPEPSVSHRSRLPLLLGLFVGLGLVVGLLVLLASILTGVLGILFLAGGFFLFLLSHYVLWGWWLGLVLRADDEEPLT